MKLHGCEFTCEILHALRAGTMRYTCIQLKHAIDLGSHDDLLLALLAWTGQTLKFYWRS